jgi:transcriptional regulator with XRE-family HTH domain
MLTQSSNGNNGLGLNVTRRQALGHFLRERRAEIAPEEVGIASRRGRRTPGLRREEVAFLADIGVKWYARLEAGDDVRPSAATLTGIAFALRLSSAAIEYVLELAGLPQPLPATAEVDTGIAGPISSLMDSMRGVAATMGDRILTPLRWNALADALYGHSRANLPAKRNALVRSLLDPDYIALLGPAREAVVAREVGMFRLNFWSTRPSPFVLPVYEMIKDETLFQEAWRREIVACELTEEGVTVLNHAAVGRLVVFSRDFGTSGSADLILRTQWPADEETAVKFRRLEAVGEDRVGNAPFPLEACG